MFVLFFFLWVLYNGQLTLEIALFGILISAVMYRFCCSFLGHSFSNDKKYIANLKKISCYLLNLVKEIIAANIGVLKIILSKELNIEPVVVIFNPSLNKEMECK